MAKMRHTEREKWEKLKITLDKFGKSSGLFEEITLRTLGKTDSDPFQIMVKISGPRDNIMDVGYGVSQILPILVDLLTSDSPKTYLLQQPEIHLHPRAQADLANFLIDFAKKSNSTILIETHSDYLIDRFRMGIRDSDNFSPDDLSLLFFDRHKSKVDIHQLDIDEKGNLLGTPENYREFFIKEEEKILGIF